MRRLILALPLLTAMCASPHLVERIGKPIDVNAPQAVRQCAEHPELKWCHHASR